jgi:hypothetical protein
VLSFESTSVIFCKIYEVEEFYGIIGERNHMELYPLIVAEEEVC